jgi:hypothetical protein
MLKSSHPGLFFLWVCPFFLLLACSNSDSTESASEETSEGAVVVDKLDAPEVLAPVPMTSGKIRLIGLPAEGMTACEVLVVDQLEPEARKRIERQRELLEQKLTGKDADQAIEKEIGMSQEQYQGFSQQIYQLAQAFPQVWSEDVKIDPNSRGTIRVSSDADVHKEIKALFDVVTFDNLERALPVLGEKLQAQSDRLHIAAKSAEGESYHRIRLTLDWLGSVAEHLNQYIAVRNEIIRAQRAYVNAYPQEPQDWDGYSVYYRDTMLIDVSQHTLGAAMVGSDGLFEVEGTGEIIVRVEYAPNSAYFIVSEDEKRVRIENLAP